MLRFLVIIALFSFSIFSAQAQMRNWSDDRGRKVEAEFVGTEGAGATAKVKLKTPAGKVLTFPVAKLSEQDRIFVKSSLPTDPRALASEIDKLVLNKMKTSFHGLKSDLEKLAKDEDLTASQKSKRRDDILRELEMCKPNGKTNDEQFMRRIYLDLAGRIPTFDEASRFLDASSRDKRADLIDELLESEAFSMRMFNFFSDLLRVREGIEMMGNDLKADPYIEWIKICMDEDKPYNKMVEELLTASGHIWENPATGYMIADTGMRMCNLSNTFTIFMGTEITCAQCHDHPFESVKQLDFYRMASFIGETETRARRGSAPKGSSPKGGMNEVDRMSKILKEAGKMREDRDRDRVIADIIGSFRFNVHDTGRQMVSLPHDYKYDNGAPRQKVQPIPYIGDDVDLAKYKTKREAFAQWVTSEGNPRFTINIVNRLWKMAFGLGQIEPVYNIPGHMDDQAQNYELLVFLEKMMQDLDYSVKDFLRVIYNTEAYQREAETLTPSLTQIDNGTYHFPGPVLRRMSAEQLWDSLVTLTTRDPEQFKRRGWDEYREVMRTDTTQLKTADDIVAYKSRYQSIGGLVQHEEEMMDSKKASRVGGQQMVRASELRQPMRPGHFLRMFGQSDKQLIENQFTTGSTPQVMALLNGVITNQVLTNPDAYLINEIVNGDGNRRDKVGKIFISVLGREPTATEKSKASSAMRARVDRDASERNKLKAENAAIGNVIWALVNTREFMFIQ